MNTDYSMRYKEPKKDTRLYCIWKRMKSRCNNPNKDNYKQYGGKGIKVCHEWSIRKHGYENFYNWALTHGYKNNLTLDRKDSNKDYSPNNCRWVTSTINSRYSGQTKLSIGSVKKIRELYSSGDYTLKSLARLFDVRANTIGYVIQNKIWKNIEDSEIQYDRNKNKKFTYDTEKNNLDKYKKRTPQELIDKISEMYKTMRVVDISRKLNINYSTVYGNIKYKKQKPR